LPRGEVQRDIFAEREVPLLGSALVCVAFNAGHGKEVNAIQAMPKGGILAIRSCEKVAAPPAGVSATQDCYACLHVEDTGMGMTGEQLRHAFEPFFTTKDVGNGTGLGLSVAHGIVRDHGGWITATSALDKGSRFSLYLPSVREREAANAQNNSDRG